MNDIIESGIDTSVDTNVDAGAEMMNKIYGFLISMLQTYSKVLIGVGVVLLVLGLIFLIFSRRVIKVLYFFGGLVVISFISMLIGTIILYFNKVKPLFTDPSLLERDNPFGGVFKAFIILLIVSLVLGLVIGILAAIYGKFGIVLVGLACGMMIGLAIGVTTGNAIAIGCLTIGLGIILAVLCGFYKRLFEVITASIAGGFLFSNGYRLVFTGAIYFKPERLESTDKYTKSISISTLVIYIVLTLGFGLYHLRTYKRKESIKNNNNESEKSPY